MKRRGPAAPSGGTAIVSLLPVAGASSLFYGRSHFGAGLASAPAAWITCPTSSSVNRLSIAIVVLHDEPMRERETHPHHKLLCEMLRSNPDWQKIYYDQPHCNRHTATEEISIYAYKPDPVRKISQVEVDLENKIGRTLRY